MLFCVHNSSVKLQNSSVSDNPNVKKITEHKY